MGYRKYRDAHHRRDDYYLPSADVARELVSVAELCRLTGCSGVTVRRFASHGDLPTAGANADGPLFDLADDRIARWVSALQGAGYDRRPAEIV